MQSRRVVHRLLHRSAQLGHRDEVLNIVLTAGRVGYLRGPKGLWRTLVSNAGSRPVVLGSLSTMEVEATHPPEEKQPKRTRKYQTGMKTPYLRKDMVGLYGYEILKTAKGFRIFAQDAIDK